jgi:proline iminopeptidase
MSTLTFDSYFPRAGIEYYYYDPLGSAYSDQSDAPELGTYPASSKKLNKCARHSSSTGPISICGAAQWGGILAMGYALKLLATFPLKIRHLSSLRS